jgi:NAD-dependent SIR2 family protein deacetylase
MNAFGAIANNCKLLLFIGTGISADEGLLLFKCPFMGDFDRPTLLALRVAAAELLRLGWS